LIRRKKLVLIAAVLAAASVAVAVAAYATLSSSSPPCNGLVCGPIPYPEIQSGRVYTGTNGPTNCELLTDAALCPVYFNAGDNGTVVIGVNEMDATPGTYVGGIQVQLLIYSSDSQYVTFTSMPSCGYTVAPPLNTAGCVVLGSSPQPFTFGFTVSKDYPSYSSTSGHWPSSITVSVVMSCCWP
jgi:chitodextrinase